MATAPRSNRAPGLLSLPLVAGGQHAQVVVVRDGCTLGGEISGTTWNLDFHLVNDEQHLPDSRTTSQCEDDLCDGQALIEWLQFREEGGSRRNSVVSRPAKSVSSTWVGVAGLTMRRSERTTRLALTK